MIYLDNAATTPISPEVLEAMMPYLREEFGNAGTLYKLGRNAKEAIENSRKQVAKLINAKPNQIIFTSGASEANSSVFNSIKDDALFYNKTEILLSNIEHDSVWKAAENTIPDGFSTVYIPTQSNGTIKIEDAERLITPNTCIVSVMGVNNETGAINPINEIAELCRKKKVLFHTDCVQAIGQIAIDVEKIDCDFLTISSHKIHGPKGVGALYLKNPDCFIPMILGGHEQEYGRRGGTENVAGIVGFGKACEQLLDIKKDFSDLKMRFYTTLIKELVELGIPSNVVKENSPWSKSTDKILNLTIKGVDSETLVLMLDSSGICISAGSACRSKESKPSRTLVSMGLTPEDARCSVRVSFSQMNTETEVVIAAKVMASSIALLKRMGGEV